MATRTCFLSGRWRPNLWPFWVLIGFEFALTVALLTFVGIAAPNLYRSRLRADGAENGFNSSPSAKLYAAANYEPYEDPVVWSQFLTNYSLVIVVLSMFLMLVKSIMYMLHVFPPIISVVVHTVLVILYTVATYFHASSDTTDPDALQNGPPWYITKSCSVARHPSNVGYCQQAKATFACTVTILCLFVIYLGFAIFSCFPSAQQKTEFAERRRLHKEKYGFLDEAENDEYDYDRAAEPSTPGLNPMTPRTLAFNKLGGTKNVPLRIATAKKNAGVTSARESRASIFGLRSPGLPRTPGNQARFTDVDDSIQPTTTSGAVNLNDPMYFPPPPRQATNK